MAHIIPAQGDLQVYIAESVELARASGIQRPYAVVVPDPDHWNDYGRGYFATLWLAGRQPDREGQRFGLMFEGHDRTKKVLDELLAQNGALFPIEKVSLPFVSLLPEELRYQEIFRVFGFDDGISLLRKLHDSVVERLERLDAKRLELIDSEDFSVGMLRQSGARTALRRAGRFFRRDIPAAVNDAAGKIPFSTVLKSADNAINIEFDFTAKPIIRDRIAVLIGRNGVGKTQLLKSMVESLPQFDGLEGVADIPDFRPAYSRALVFSSVPTDPYPRSIPAWNKIDYEYFPISASREPKDDPLLTALVACKYEHSPVRFGPDRRSRFDVLEGVLEEMGLWQRLHLPLRSRAEGENLGYVIETPNGRYLPINSDFNELGTLQAVQRIDFERAPIVLDDEMRPRALSSGEYVMLRFAAQAIAAIEQGSLLFLDEPETHLHPNYVSELMEILYSLLKTSGSVAIIATHSAYIVREVSREGVKIMTLEDRYLRVDTPRMQTFGASIDTISQFVFGDTDRSHHYQDILRKWAESEGQELGIDQIIERYGSSLNSESLSYMARVLQREEGEEL